MIVELIAFICGFMLGLYLVDRYNDMDRQDKE
jgi:hypothetical protein